MPPSKRIRRIWQRIRVFLNPLPRVENINSQVNPAIFESNDEGNSCPVYYWTINQYSTRAATTGQLCRHYRALHGACSEHIFCRGEMGTTVNLDTIGDVCGHAISIWIRYVWTRKFLNLESRKKVAYSKISRYVWTGPKLQFIVELQTILGAKSIL